jgi:hypothetical protein
MMQAAKGAWVGGGARGFTVAETLIALVLGWALAYLALSTFSRQRTLQVTMTHRAEALAAVRTARNVLHLETRVGDPQRDGWSLSPDSLGIRAFRGTALVCPFSEPLTEVLVQVAGTRLPDASKDSVLVVGQSGAMTAMKLESRFPVVGGCPVGPGASLERWGLSEEVLPGTVIARYYERGSYHLSGGALRYRRGAGGRQPLTPTVLDDRESAFEDRAGGVGVWLRTRPPHGSAPPWPGLVFHSGSNRRP